MEPKKNPKKDLNRQRTLFLQIGLVFALAVVFLAFEWKTYEKSESTLASSGPVQIDEEIVQITQQEQPPAPPKAPEVTTILEIVDDDVVVEDEINVDIEARADQAVQSYVPVMTEEEPAPVAEEIFTFVEEYPEFPGGDKALREYILNNIKYPEVARTSGITGTVYVQFVVEKDGSISDVKVVRGIGGGCDEEAVRVVKSMPRWKPGKQRGQPVRVYFTLPIEFKLM
ncbi:MAG: Gram-negative bacterial tonB protein [Bacteroidetes bacterium ADurb.Bin035]|jgi:protein TonB|nr:MAG: Gram-negative bacterial tonB protein [Bacteroidetes bacterium ADurb.Bin035]HNT70115.1 energy transducer TonB [Bacteroidales bacterium]HNY75565.1 energy transducer TonB [Bacteroidales bacterium]HOC41244.1 energy transducer TonB [Bacteroidales bacterium]HOH93531.1 energy transducer TonB [Bacteroidales bacterium]